MPRPRSMRRTPTDLTDGEVFRLRRLAFSIAREIQEMQSDAGREKRGARMALIERMIADHASPTDKAAELFTIGQVAHFLADGGYYEIYVPPDPLEDEEWLRYMIDVRGASDSALAFQIARSTRGHPAPDVEKVTQAREGFGIAPSDRVGENEDTLDILARLEEEPRASDFLSDRDWMERRVVERDMSDGAIARELEGIGAPCDRSTVRGYRSDFGLARPDEDAQ